MDELDGSYLTDDGDELEEVLCPSCRGRCYDRDDNPCDECFGEGTIDILCTG